MCERGNKEDLPLYKNAKIREAVINLINPIKIQNFEQDKYGPMEIPEVLSCA